MLVEPLRIPATDGYPLAATLYGGRTAGRLAGRRPAGWRGDGRPAGGETAGRLRSL